MGIDPIEYTPWHGKRSGISHRMFVVIKKILNTSVRSKGVIVLLLIGGILVHLFPIITAVIFPQEKLTAEIMVRGTPTLEPYMRGELFLIFSILLAAVVTSDLISSDYHDNSFILYFSRPIKPPIYMISKFLGGISVISLFCFVMPMLFCITVISTQTGSDYWTSFKVMGLTALAGVLTTFFFTAMGLMLSSMTKRKAYAGVGTFVAFFAPTLIAEIFSEFNVNWRLLSPINVLHYTYDLIYGYDIPHNIDTSLFYVALFTYLLLPLVITYIVIQRRAVGK